MLTAEAKRGSNFCECVDASRVRAVAVADLQSGYTPRQSRLDDGHVASLIEVVDRLPPVIVNEQTMTVLDGAHRVEAFRRLGRRHIDAMLFSGNELDAMVVAVQANVTHGKPLSRIERQAAARALLRVAP